MGLGREMAAAAAKHAPATRAPTLLRILGNHAHSRPKRTNKWAYVGALVGVASFGSSCGWPRLSGCGLVRVVSCGWPRAHRLCHTCVSCLGIGLHWTKSFKSFQCLTSRGESSRRLLPRVRPSQTQVPPSQRQAAATRNKPSEMIIKAMHLWHANVCKRMPAYTWGSGWEGKWEEACISSICISEIITTT